MTCRLEKRMTAILEEHGIAYRIPERDRRDPTNLDFYLIDLGVYIEVKQFHTDRIARQLRKVPERSTAILLMGPRAVEDFERLCMIIGMNMACARCSAQRKSPQ